MVLEPNHDATAEAIRQRCKSLIANYECPRSVEIVSADPVSVPGKVLKSALRAPHGKAASDASVDAANAKFSAEAKDC
ncbi:MAG TPA: hypothetical protein VJR89_06435 [Polyangiales bacterium]|nr:hypothetical protein [Polyangiales bacterium]